MGSQDACNGFQNADVIGAWRDATTLSSLALAPAWSQVTTMLGRSALKVV